LADEPTTAVDATVQAQVLKVLETACRSRGMAVVLVTHDLGIAMHLCDRILVMYGGRVMESGPVEAFLDTPRHPYTRGLIDAFLDVREPARSLKPIPGRAASIVSPLSGCPFASRCDLAIDACRVAVPSLRPVGQDHWVACDVVTGGIDRVS
jgi:oligopeptide/dipeptide ABC transporter ATP-binding protein